MPFKSHQKRKQVRKAQKRERRDARVQERRERAYRVKLPSAIPPDPPPHGIDPGGDPVVPIQIRDADRLLVKRKVSFAMRGIHMDVPDAQVSLRGLERISDSGLWEEILHVSTKMPRGELREIVDDLSRREKEERLRDAP